MSESPGPAEPAQAAPSLEQLLADTEARLQEQREAWLRALADTENVRKRAQLEVATARRFGAERVVEMLLPVMDSLEAALGAAEGSPPAMRDGVELTLRQLKAAFQKANLVEIAPAAGERFDPHRHQAMAAVEAESAAPNSIVSVMLKGYSLHDRIVRPALVTVAKALENKGGNPIYDGNLNTN